MKMYASGNVSSHVISCRKNKQPLIKDILQSYLKSSFPNVAKNISNLPKGKIMQRVVRREQSIHSQNDQYIISTLNSNILYSRTNARDPVPISLYTKGTDVTDDDPPVVLSSWTPNVRFFTDEEIAQVLAKPKKNVPSRKWCGLAACFGITKAVPDHAIEEGMVRELRERITGAPGSPQAGIVGKNDCGEFATYLQNLIYAGSDRPELAQPRDPLDTRIGDKMKHLLTDPDDCPYHCATIIAADGVSKITLEANAGDNLRVPNFFIREGIRGFMRDNNADYDNGTKHEITRLDSITPKENQEYMNSGHLDDATFRELEVRDKSPQRRPITSRVLGV